jgi:precorrin-6A/cobalt-precorrin-6A reductase
VNYGDVLVMGGTSDARMLCQQLDAATCLHPVGGDPDREAAGGRHQRQVRCGRLEREQMIAWLQENQTRWVIDASHPYAEVVSRNIMNACEAAGVLLSRYQRPEQLSGLTHPQLYTVQSIASLRGCATLRRRVLLTTGSKDLALARRVA